VDVPIHLVEVSSSRLSETLGRSTHKAPRLDEDSTQTHQVLSLPRLGEPFSPKRVYLSLNTPKHLAYTSRAQNVQVSL